MERKGIGQGRGEDGGGSSGRICDVLNDLRGEFSGVAKVRAVILDEFRVGEQGLVVKIVVCDQFANIVLQNGFLEHVGYVMDDVVMQRLREVGADWCIGRGRGVQHGGQVADMVSGGGADHTTLL